MVGLTGQKNRFKTHEKLWNIDDKQLKTPKHDALVLWLMDETNLRQYIGNIPVYSVGHRYSNKWNEGTHDNYKISSEVPIMSSRTFIAGYGDIVVHIEREKKEEYEEFPLSIEWVEKILNCRCVKELLNLVRQYTNDDELELVHYDSTKIRYVYKDNEPLIDSDGDSVKVYYSNQFTEFKTLEYMIIDFLKSIHIEFDLNEFRKGDILDWAIRKSKFRYKYSSGKFSVLIEIKPYIDSFGAVLRQIKSYKTFSGYGEYWLFTLDDRFDKQFESQNIRVIHPPHDFDLYEYIDEMGLN